MAKASEDSHATWSVADEEALIAFLQTRQAEAGDGTHFKAAAVAHLATQSRREAVLVGPKLPAYTMMGVFWVVGS